VFQKVDNKKIGTGLMRCINRGISQEGTSLCIKTIFFCEVFFQELVQGHNNWNWVRALRG